MKYPLADVVFEDKLPKSVEVLDISQNCSVEELSDAKIFKCVLGNIAPKERGK